MSDTPKRPRPLPGVGPIWSTPVAPADDPELIAEQKALREKFIAAGVIPSPPVQEHPNNEEHTT